MHTISIGLFVGQCLSSISEINWFHNPVVCTLSTLFHSTLLSTSCRMHMHTVSSITDVYTVSQLKSHMADKPEYSPSSLFTGIVYAVLTSLDIDTDNYKTVIGQKW